MQGRAVRDLRLLCRRRQEELNMVQLLKLYREDILGTIDCCAVANLINILQS